MKNTWQMAARLYQWNQTSGLSVPFGAKQTPATMIAFSD
jgi:hypothetical protein